MNVKPFHSLLLIVAAIAIPESAIGKVSEQTLKNLNTAFQGESNASNKYSAFAQKADAEGNAQVAKLFRAASAAEAIHRDAHKAAIAELGGTVDSFKLDEVTPATTAENLKSAIKGESYERDTMYPGFLATAKADDAKAAIRTIQFAAAAEKEHESCLQGWMDVILHTVIPEGYSSCAWSGPRSHDAPLSACQMPGGKGDVGFPIRQGHAVFSRPRKVADPGFGSGWM